MSRQKIVCTMPPERASEEMMSSRRQSKQSILGDKAQNNSGVSNKTISQRPVKARQ